MLGDDDYSNIYLAGFGEGARMVYYVQLGLLTEPLGGAFTFMGYPLVPMFGLEPEITYDEDDMHWMMFYA